MDSKNVLLAIVLSTLVLVFWATFFEPPPIEMQTKEKKITENEIRKENIIHSFLSSVRQKMLSKRR